MKIKEKNCSFFEEKWFRLLLFRTKLYILNIGLESPLINVLIS